MRIHHLDCGTMCPVAGRLLGAAGPDLFTRGHLVCHCLLLETARDGLVLVETGFGTADCTDPTRLPSAFRALASPRLALADTALHRVRALGFTAADVRHVVVTHLDLDHAGGLSDFPHATVHLHRRELDAATKPATWAERNRYLPHQWAHRPRWSAYTEDGDTWLGLPAVRRLTGLDADIALLPLHGHTRGHSAVVVRDRSGWLLHAGDAYFHHRELVEPVDAPIGVRAFQTVAQVDAVGRLASQAALRRLHREHPEVAITSAHDPAELARERFVRRTALSGSS